MTFGFILYCIGFALFFVMAITYVRGGFSAAPWVPTRGKDAASFLELAAVRPGEKVYDLGCGDGRMLRLAADQGARAVGYEISVIPYLLARLRLRDIKGGGTAEVRFRDFWQADFRDADVVYCFLSSKSHAALGARFKKELKPGARVVTYVWGIKGWNPVATRQTPSGLKAYLYQAPS